MIGLSAQERLPIRSEELTGRESFYGLLANRQMATHNGVNILLVQGLHTEAAASRTESDSGRWLRPSDTG